VGILEVAEHGDSHDVLLLDRDAHLAARSEYGLHLSDVIGWQLRTQLTVDALGPLEPLGLDEQMLVVGDADDFHGKSVDRGVCDCPKN
jgi:hypothetical protein